MALGHIAKHDLNARVSIGFLTHNAEKADFLQIEPATQLMSFAEDDKE